MRTEVKVAVMFNSLRPRGLYSPWNSPGQNTAMGSLSLLQGYLPNPGIKPRSPALWADSLPSEPPGKPYTDKSDLKGTAGSACLKTSLPLSPGCLHLLMLMPTRCRSPRGRATLHSVGLCVRAKSLQLCLTLCNPMDCSPPVSSVHGVLQARILEWVAMPSSRGSSQLPQGSN